MATETTAKTAEAVKATASDKVKATTEQYTAAGATAFKGGIEKSLAGLNEMNAQSKRNLEAVVASATAAAKGAETLGTQTMAFSKSAVEKPRGSRQGADRRAQLPGSRRAAKRLRQVGDGNLHGGNDPRDRDPLGHDEGHPSPAQRARHLGHGNHAGRPLSSTDPANNEEVRGGDASGLLLARSGG